MNCSIGKRFVATICSLALMTRVLAADGETGKAAPQMKLSPEQIQKLVAELDNDQYAVRLNATRELSKAGPAAIGPLTQAAKTGSLEVVTRAIGAIEKIYVSGDDQAAEAAETALEELARHKSESVSGRAESVMTKRYEIRERRAVVEIQKAGGIFKRGTTDENVDPANTPGLTYAETTLHIGKEWKAGDAGLKHVRRLTRLQNIRFIPGSNGVTKEGINSLVAAIPNLFVHERGTAKLGMVGQPSITIPGCEVLTIAQGSAAEEAKLQAGDIITRFGDKKIENFDMLVELIKTKKPGDRLEMEVQRRGVEAALKLPVTLKDWDESAKRPGK